LRVGPRRCRHAVRRPPKCSQWRRRSQGCREPVVTQTLGMMSSAPSGHLCNLDLQQEARRPCRRDLDRPRGRRRPENAWLLGCARNYPRQSVVKAEPWAQTTAFIQTKEYARLAMTAKLLLLAPRPLDASVKTAIWASIVVRSVNPYEPDARPWLGLEHSSRDNIPPEGTPRAFELTVTPWRHFETDLNRHMADHRRSLSAQWEGQGTRERFRSRQCEGLAGHAVGSSICYLSVEAACSWRRRS